MARKAHLAAIQIRPRAAAYVPARGGSKASSAALASPMFPSRAIQRDPAGRPEQFTSQLRILEGDGSGGSLLKQAEISVNHPLRFQGVTL